MSDIKALLRALEAFESHLDEREGEDLRELGRPKEVTLEVEAEPSEVGAEDCPLCAKGEECPEHATKPAGGMAAKLAALGGE